MNYLVTGAAGFIGSAIAQYLIDNGNTCTTKISYRLILNN